MQLNQDGRVSWLNYHHLYYFKIIAEEGSIAKAAQKLRLGQPTLSAQLKQFEQQLGQTLFDRKHKRLVLTDSGRLTLDYAREIFKLGTEMVEALNDRLVPNRIHVQLGALDSVPKQLILRLVSAAYKVGPCVVSILEGRGDELQRELSAHRLDLLVANFTPLNGGQDKMVAKSIARLPVMMFGAAKFKDLKRHFPKSMSGAPIILPTAHSKLRADLEHYFELANLQLSAVAETQDTSLQRMMAESEMGLIAATPMAVADLVKEKKLVPLGALPNVYEEFYLMGSSRQIENPISSYLLKNFTLGVST